jgi:hypothetical protein
MPLRRFESSRAHERCQVSSLIERNKNDVDASKKISINADATEASKLASADLRYEFGKLNIWRRRLRSMNCRRSIVSSRSVENVEPKTRRTNMSLGNSRSMESPIIEELNDHKRASGGARKINGIRYPFDRGDVGPLRGVYSYTGIYWASARRRKGLLVRLLDRPPNVGRNPHAGMEEGPIWKMAKLHNYVGICHCVR